jgi:hypothetical protein
VSAIQITFFGDFLPSFEKKVTKQGRNPTFSDRFFYKNSMSINFKVKVISFDL